jgi:hypothetical protein
MTIRRRFGRECQLQIVLYCRQALYFCSNDFSGRNLKGFETTKFRSNAPATLFTEQVGYMDASINLITHSNIDASPGAVVPEGTIGASKACRSGRRGTGYSKTDDVLICKALALTKR